MLGFLPFLAIGALKKKFVFLLLQNDDPPYEHKFCTRLFMGLWLLTSRLVSKWKTVIKLWC